MAQNIYDSIFYINVHKIHPNPYQPRREFDQGKLEELAESIRQYGVLQPVVVTRKEREREDGGLEAEYELISGERRLRASKIAGVGEIPAVIRSSEETDRMKLELAIIENLQREDLNPIDRALAFRKLIDEFGFKHGQVAQKIGKSREFVSNSIRILQLPQEMLDALRGGTIMEGHTRPLLMLVDRPEEQQTLFREITTKRLTVRESEDIARRIAKDRVRKQNLSPEIMEIEGELTEYLGTRVKINKRDNGGGGRMLIDFFSEEDLQGILRKMKQQVRTEVEQEMQAERAGALSQNHTNTSDTDSTPPAGTLHAQAEEPSSLRSEESAPDEETFQNQQEEQEEKKSEEDEDLYSIRNFSL